MSAIEYPTLSQKVRVVILANHEERDLPMCLAGVPSGIGVTVIDSGSTDRTMDIAREHGAQVIEHPFEGFAAQRNFALTEANVKGDWIVFIDADEVFSKSFWDWAEKTLSAGDPPVDAVYVTSLLVLDGHVLKHAPAYPVYHSRFVRNRRAIFVDGDTSHNETILKDLRTSKVDAPYLHYFQAGPLLPWMKKHLGLADEEVHEGEDTVGIRTGRAMLNRSLGNSPLKALLRFFYHYLFCLGFLDGKAGLRYSAMYAWYELSKWVMSLEEPAEKNALWVKRLETKAKTDAVSATEAPRPVAHAAHG